MANFLGGPGCEPPAKKERTISKYEAALPGNAHLEHTHTKKWVVESVLTVGSVEHPRWTTCYWHVYGPCIARWARSRHRVGSTDNAPAFDDLDTAREVMAAIEKAHHGRLRNRLVCRWESIHEEVVEP